MDRPNFYILLELDPSQKDPSAIQAAIDQKQGEWSRDRNRPDKGREAQRNLELLPNIKEVLGDGEKREAEAREAKTILQEVERKAYQQLDEIIGILASPGYLLEKQVKDLVKRFKGELREEQVRGRIKVEIREEPSAEKRAKKPVLRRQLMKEIADRLELIDKEKLHDLYDFLDRPRNSSLSVLQGRAQECGIDTRHNRDGPLQADRGFGHMLDPGPTGQRHHDIRVLDLRKNRFDVLEVTLPFDGRFTYFPLLPACLAGEP